MHHATKRGFKDCPGFLNSTGRLGPRRGRKCYITPAFSGVPNKGNKIRTQNLRRGGTLMHHATKRGFKDCPGFLNSTGRLGPRRGRKCYITPAFSGVPNKGNKIRTQNLRRGGTLMHHATKRGFKDCPGFLNSTGQNWPACGQTGYVTPVVSGIPTAIELGGRIRIGPLVGKVAT